MGVYSEHKKLSLSLNRSQKSTPESTPSFKDNYLTLRVKRAKLHTYPGNWTYFRTEIGPSFKEKDHFLRSEKSQTKCVCVRSQTDFIRLVSSKLMLLGASRCPERPFRSI